MPKGTGKATALTLARMGADVAVTGFGHLEGAEAVAGQIRALGRKSVALKMDGRDDADVRKAFAAIKNELGPVSILINNAPSWATALPSPRPLRKNGTTKQGSPRLILRLLLHKGSMGRYERDKRTDRQHDVRGAPRRLTSDELRQVKGGPYCPGEIDSPGGPVPLTAIACVGPRD